MGGERGEDDTPSRVASEDADGSASPRTCQTAPDRLGSSFDRDAISEEVRRQYNLVPTIGTGRRWYDTPYRVLDWFLTGGRRRFIPWRLRSRVNDGLNFLNVFNHYERLKVQDPKNPSHNLVIRTCVR